MVAPRTGAGGSQEYAMFYTRGLTLHSTIEASSITLSAQ
jgi:hypothetical protein